MKKAKLFLLAALLLVGFSGVAYPWGATGGDGSNYQQLQETAVFFNNAGSTLSAGQLVVLDTGGTGVATGTTLGSYVSLPKLGGPGGATDSILAIGVVKSVSTSDQRPVVVVTKGPVNATCADSSDAVSNSTAVGTTPTILGQCGGGTNLGIALEAGDGTDGATIRIWVDPTGAD